MISPENAIAFQVCGIEVRFYSLIMLVAIICGTFLTCSITKYFYKNVSVEKILDILPIIVICAVFGARFYYVLLDLNFYLKNPIEIFAFWHGGLSIHGALLGGFLGGICCAKKYKLDLWSYADVFSYGLLLGQAIGRFGNYFNIEAFGKPCSFSNLICMYVPQIKRPYEYYNVEYFHPTFLYESIWNIFALVLLFFVIRPLAKKYNGVVFFAYLVLYSVGRLIIEHIRLDSVLMLGSLHIAEIVSIFIIIFSVIMIFLRIKSFQK